VQPDGKMRSMERRVYKILRPDGRRLGKLHLPFDNETKLTNFHAWCIPQHGKDYEVSLKDSVESALNGDPLMLYDVRLKVVDIPAPDVGNVIGWELEHTDRPYVLQDYWDFQGRYPVKEARYVLQLPPGWNHKASSVNHSEITPTSVGPNAWQWTVT